jgi:pSer/pThr/pTyr-binding forkhead associated (FHA) protein
MPSLYVLSGDDAGRSFDFAGTVVLGRVKGVDWILRSSSVSRRHARLEPVEDGWELVDLGSSNGTSLGGRRIERVRLTDGDVLRLGDCELRFRSDAPATNEPVASIEPEPEEDALETELELEGDWEDAAPADPAPAPLRTPQGARPAATRTDRGERAASPLDRASAAPGGERDVLQYKRVEQRAGLFAADLSQQPVWMRWLAYLLAVGLFLAFAFGAYQLTLTLRRQGEPPPEVETF